MSTTKSLLYHLPLRKTTYTHASHIQESLVTLHLLHKRLLSPSTSTSPSSHNLPPIPPPTIITSEFHPPVYTSGLRQYLTFPADEKSRLTTGVHPVSGVKAGFISAKRGGQVTWHGEGQCTIYPVVNLRGVELVAGGSGSGSGKGTKVSKPGIGIRDWVNTLEGVTIDTLKREYGITSFRDKVHPGVWVGDAEEGKEEDTRKITAIGVRARRFIANHGIGMNVSTDPWWWDRVVACGIEGRGVTSIKQEFERRGEKELKVPSVEEVGGKWVAEIARRLGREVKVVRVEEVLGEGWEEKFAKDGEEEGGEW